MSNFGTLFAMYIYSIVLELFYTITIQSIFENIYIYDKLQ